MQLLLVLVVIFVPQSVTAFLDKPEVVDVNSVVLEAAPAPDNAPADGQPADDPMKDLLPPPPGDKK